METQEKNKKVIRTLYEEVLNTGQLDKVPELVSVSYTGPQDENGPEGFANTIMQLRTGFPDIRWTIEDLLAEGNEVVIRWSWVGTHKGVVRGFAPTGKKVTNTAIAIYTLENGKVTHAILQSDRLGFLQQIGVVADNVIPSPPKKN